MQVPSLTDRLELDCDVLVVGGGTAGTMAAISAAEAGARVLVLEKAHVRHSGALAMGMDGVNNAVIPGRATPEEYVAEITRANDGVVNQRTIYQTASRGHDMIRRLERYGVKFEKDAHGQYAVRQVHRSGSYVLPMPEGRDIKKVLYRVLRERSMRERVRIENRVMPVRVLTDAGRAVGVAGLHTRTGEFVTVTAGAVVLATGACGRLGLPASGYLYGTYENPTNAGDGYAMAYHAGAELSGIECFQINPLIKDYNGPACAYVANPFGGYQVNNRGERFVDCDYWSGQMMAEVAREIASARGPIYLKLTHLPEETISALEGILHSTERPTRGTFHAGRGHDYRSHDVEMHISEIGLCGGHSASGVWVDEHGATTVPGLYAAGDLACVPHNYMIGAFVFGDLAGTHAAGSFVTPAALPADQVAAAHALVYRPLANPDGLPQPQVEYKLRRMVNDYLAPPKTAAKLDIAVETFDRMRAEIAALGARTPHELMRCAEVTFIRDCAEMAARASLVRTESRWGLYHDRADLPQRNDDDWFCHLNLSRDAQGTMRFRKRQVAPYLVPVEGFTPPAAGIEEVIAIQPDRPGRSDQHTVAHGEPASVPASDGAVLAVLRLAEQQPSLDVLEPYLRDPDADVRRTALLTLTESAPEGTAPALVAALADDDPGVRVAAVAGLRELADILPAGIGQSLRAYTASPDVTVRALVVELLRVTGAGQRADFTAALDDPAATVRVHAVRGLVRHHDTASLAAVAADPSREVRIAVAHALGDLADSAAIPAVSRLAADPDVLVRAAALRAAAALCCPEPLVAVAVAGLTDAAWQVREGAALGLAGAPASVAVPPLLDAAHDGNLDVRRAAVRVLGNWTARPEVAALLRAAADADTDADVRAYARRALAAPAPVAPG
ncbi:fumarate reductase/succinate dehydrogenase flavoprotein subunit [Micromonospora sp. DT48]|uniref:fumarate reductase/succinate dehydrogenase flavoprotein subunit n=1 Tax=Micromonospora sp. DT48 TaxID=3393429 RepID=UPI003CE76F0D